MVDIYEKFSYNDVTLTTGKTFQNMPKREK